MRKIFVKIASIKMRARKKENVFWVYINEQQNRTDTKNNDFFLLSMCVWICVCFLSLCKK